MLLACSILRVYKGVLDVQELAVTHVMARNTKATLATITGIFFLSMLITSFPSFFSLSEKSI
ncbi:MAG: hypothetical protein AYK19_09095 [Theionarchaea archaeon DG-70-1]|nr:MAG: hypothetical protein AYK19_09095 [Theionarchaea archaeon DG-70-1]